MDSMIEFSFSDDIKFQRGRDNSFSDFMADSRMAPQYLATYSDNELRSSIKSLNPNELDLKLTAIIRLFCCLRSRDVFLTSYTERLSKRLLNKTLVSIEAEEMMISKLKVECGLNTVSKMTQMFKDLETSRHTISEFYKSNVDSNLVNGVEFVGEILTNGTWPMEESVTC
jgi:cullin 3